MLHHEGVHLSSALNERHQQQVYTGPREMRTTQVFSRNQCFKPSRPLTTPGSASSLLLPPCLFPTPKLNYAPCPGALFCSVAIPSEWVGVVDRVPRCRARGWKGAWSEDRNLESRSFSAAKIRKETQVIRSIRQDKTRIRHTCVGHGPIANACSVRAC